MSYDVILYVFHLFSMFYVVIYLIFHVFYVFRQESGGRSISEFGRIRAGGFGRIRAGGRVRPDSADSGGRYTALSHGPPS